jgi:Ca-activated chloride channel homolog
VMIPVHVNVVPGDEAAGRVPNPTVRSELAFQRAQRAKREAAEAMRSGDPAAANRLYGEAGQALEDFKPMADQAMSSEIAEEAELLRDLADRALNDDPSRTAKFTEMDRHYKERKRGRRRPPEGRS